MNDTRPLSFHFFYLASNQKQTVIDLCVQDIAILSSAYKIKELKQIYG